MDERGEIDDWGDLAEDELIKRLVPDPDNPDVNVVAGVLVGRGRDAGTVRLYTTLQLNQFVELPADRILGAKRFPSGQVVVWVPGDLNVRVTTTATLSGDYLKGSIQATHGRAGGGVGSLVAAMLGTGGGGGTSFGGCPTDIGFPGDPNCPIPIDTTSPPLCNPSPTGCRC